MHSLYKKRTILWEVFAMLSFVALLHKCNGPPPPTFIWVPFFKKNKKDEISSE